MTAASLFDDGTRGATLSDCGRYRYDLWRRWADGPLLGFVMLNPSVGDADLDDPTLTRCIGFARRDGWAGIVVRNLYAYRTPKPSTLKAAAREGVDVVGPENDEWLARLAADRFTVQRVVAAWGAFQMRRPAGRAMYVRIAYARQQLGTRLHRLDDERPLASPPPIAPHPLYLPAETPIVPYVYDCGHLHTAVAG